MERLDNPIRGYAWGSRTLIARIQGRPTPSDGPEAEMWLGAHPDSPSTLPRGGRPVPLTDIIEADPAAVLGEPVVRRFGARLPFLIKLLAAAEPLSLQVHPDARQAEAGFAAEEAAGVPRQAPHRRYLDPYHKPELLVALGEFEALCGFRDPAVSAQQLDRLGVPELAPTVRALSGPDPGQALGQAVRGLLTVARAEQVRLVDAVARGARSAAARSVTARSVTARSAAPGSAPGAGSAPEAGDPAGSLSRLATDLAGRYPADIGVVVALLLNHVCLRAGQAIWMPPGNLHAYLRGAGVEAMAASDNVLRGGLTGKHVDVDELLRLLRFEVLADPVVAAVPLAPGLDTWPVPVDEFRLYRAVVGADRHHIELPGRGPRILLCVRGEVRADDRAAAVSLCSGQAAFGAAGEGPVTLCGAGEVFQIATP